MIHWLEGNIFDSNAVALVNTVNTVGIMGKGLALEFRKRYPHNFEMYKRACFTDALKIGKPLWVEDSGKWIVNFPTKVHWKNPSKYPFIRLGLTTLSEQIVTHGIKSIAIPPLGCGLGGLNWHTVKGMIREKMKDITDVEVFVYEPAKYK